MLIKIIKLFGSLVPFEPKLGRRLLEPLTSLINSTSAMSLLYECINTVIAILISISSEGPGDYTPSIQASSLAEELFFIFYFLALRSKIGCFN
uniref:Uncharacterized protein n=1 Tax=Meloidogyne enterolobii TaxID=390850 RepID=A0A6V7TS94_MELEN|nr:unnamed protein product [Meloidogyne enterolobii]